MTRRPDLVTDLVAHAEALKVSHVYAKRRGDYDKADLYWEQYEEACRQIDAGEQWIVHF